MSDTSSSSSDASSWWRSGEAAAQQIEIGHRFMLARRYDRAVQSFRAAVALEPHNPDAHCRLAIALLEEGQVAEADAVSILALAMWPDLTPILQVRGAVLRALGRLEEGTELLRRVAVDNPEQSAFTGFWGGALYEEGRFEEATAAARSTLLRDPEDWRALLLLALCLVAQSPTAQHRREVNAATQHALQLAPDEAMTHAVLGACYAQTNQPEAARQSLAKALQLEPQNALAAYWNRVLDHARSAAN